VAYGSIGSMRTKPGCRDEVAALLISAADGLRTVGCSRYLVFASESDPDLIWVTEVWESKGLHDASLKLPEVTTTIATAMPMLTGEFTREELTILGGLGV
jgi:quinol monooxygenase YgiN